MNIETARASVGMLVMSLDSGNGCRKCPLDEPIGPFRLKQITKGGMAIVSHLGNIQLRPKWLTLCSDQSQELPPEPGRWTIEEILSTPPTEIAPQNPHGTRHRQFRFKTEPLAFLHFTRQGSNP